MQIQMKETLKVMTMLVTVGLIGLTISCVSAKADTFIFSFSNTIGNVAGTVTGTITLPSGCFGCAATDVTLTDFPAGLDSVYGSAPIDLTAIGWYFTDNFMDEQSGEVSFEEMAMYGPAGESVLYLNEAGADWLVLDDTFAADVLNTGGFAAITFTPQGGPVPEPETWATLGAGIISMAWLKLRPRPSRGLRFERTADAGTFVQPAGPHRHFPAAPAR